MSDLGEKVRFIHAPDRTICLLTLPSGMGFMAIGTHENENEAEQLAYEDALQKSKVISIESIILFRNWKRQHRQMH
jgi:hypothetical protein